MLVTILVPSGLTAAEVALLWPSRVVMSWPLAASQSRVVPLGDVVTKVPSGPKAAETTPSLGTGRTASVTPVAASQSRAVPSPEPVTTIAPSGLTAADQTGPWWPRSAVRPRCSSSARYRAASVSGT